MFEDLATAMLSAVLIVVDILKCEATGQGSKVGVRDIGLSYLWLNTPLIIEMYNVYCENSSF